MIEINTDLIRRAQTGDTATLGELYERYQLSIFRYLYYRVGDRQTAEDLTSEVFERMLRFLAGFNPPSSSFQAWLFRIARNLSTDHYRKMSVRNDVQLEENLISVNDDPHTTIERVLTIEGLRQALAKLNEEQRDVILLRFVSGMPISEVAHTLNKSEDAIKGLQRRALSALREILVDWEVSYA